MDGLGARSAADATAVLPLSRQGADAQFQKLNVTLGYMQGFSDNRLALSLTASGQTAFGQALLRSEQLGIAGPGALSAFDAGILQGDSGFVVRGELSAPITVPLPIFDGIGILASPYVFGAGGMVELNDSTALEPGLLKGASYGAGLHLGGTQAGSLSAGSLTLEYGRQARSDAVPDGNRFTLVSSIRF